MTDYTKPASALTLDELMDIASRGGVAHDQQKILEEQMAMAQKLRDLPSPGTNSVHTMFGEQLMAPPPLATLLSTLAQLKGGQQVNAIRGPTPVDQRTGQPISQYVNLETTAAGDKAVAAMKIQQEKQIRDALLEMLRSGQNQQARVPNAMGLGVPQLQLNVPPTSMGQ